MGEEMAAFLFMRETEVFSLTEIPVIHSLPISYIAFNTEL